MVKQCITCGRPFPEGQGITLSMVGNELTFHSKACAYRFLKEVVLMIEPESLSGAIREVLKRHEKRIEEAKKKMEKKI